MREAGRSVPFLDNAPELDTAYRAYYEAFHFLSDMRPRTADVIVNRIPLSEIESYLRLFKITDEFEVQNFVHLIVAMDKVYVPLMEAYLIEEKRKAQAKQ